MTEDTSERYDVPTPNGGDYYIVHFLSSEGELVGKMQATHVRIEEYTASDELLKTHFAYIGEAE